MTGLMGERNVTIEKIVRVDVRENVLYFIAYGKPDICNIKMTNPEYLLGDTVFLKDAIGVKVCEA